MVLCLEKARRAWIRLPRPLHAALLELRAEHPRPVVFGTSQFVRFERGLTDWKLTDIKPGPFGINGEIVSGATLNRLGMAFAKHLQPLSNDKRTLTPLMPLADVLAELPQPIIDWLSGTPPIEKHEGGILFEVLGVLLPTFRGDGYNPSRELTLALEELAFRRSGGVLRKDGPASPYLEPHVADILRRILDENGVPWKDGGIDGRLIRSLGDKDGAGLVTLRTLPGREHFTVADQEWAVPHMMRAVARALVDGETDPFKLAVLMPDAYRIWLADGLPVSSVPPHPRLLALIGVIKRKGKYDWQFVKDYADIQHRMAAFLRAYERGDVVPDDTPYDGSGVDIVLPDSDGPADEDWAALDMSPAPAVIEAPVPSNADLEAMHQQRAARSGDISVTPDEFDIL